MRVLLSLATALGGVCVVHGSHPVADPTYVVQIHANRDGFVPPADAHEQLRTQSMTTESGQRFECFLPLTPLQKQQRALEQAAANPSAGAETRELEADAAAKELDKFLTFARAAVKKVRPMCVQFIDVVDQWVYEICPGVLIRKVGLEQRAREAPKKRRMDTVSDDGREADGRLQQGRLPQETVTETKPERVETEAKTKPESVETDAETKPKPEAAHEVQDLAAFASDDETKLPFSYEEFPNGEMQKRVTTYSKPLYTQVFRARGKSHGQVGDIHVQFLCSASARDDYVGAVAWRANGGGDDETLINKEPAAFVIASRLFCNPKHSDSSEKFSVSSLLQPLAEMQTCIKRNEGWWTYEFCFGHGIRQYHRENDGKVTAEFSLGSYDFQQNQLLDSTGASLVTEHIDAAAHDTARPAFIEMYTGGTHCKEFDVSTPRKSRVFFYCSQGSANHHIVSIKETQTCTYTIKIASPVVCDHPHFITEERKTEDKAEVVHCIPVVAGDGDGDGQVSETTTVTMPPAAAHRDQERSDVREVQVDAT